MRGCAEQTALRRPFTATLAPASSHPGEPGLFTLPSQSCWRSLWIIVRVASMTAALGDKVLNPGSSVANPRARCVLGGQVLVGACFSGGYRMRLSWVTCCLTQRGQARWKGVGVGVFTGMCVPSVKTGCVWSFWGRLINLKSPLHFYTCLAWLGLTVEQPDILSLLEHLNSGWTFCFLESLRK